MDSLQQIGTAGTADVRLEPAGLGPAGGVLSAADPGVCRDRAERRAARIALLDRAGEKTARAIDRITDYMDGVPIDLEARKALERIPDPALALVRLDKALRQIVALVDKLDESDEEREARLAEEAEARRLEEERQRSAPEDDLRERKKNAVRHAVRNALRDGNPDLHRIDRERLLDDLFSDYENYDGDYAGDPPSIVLELCREAGLSIETDIADDEGGDPDGEADPYVRAEAAALAIARRYLAAVAPDLCQDMVDEASPDEDPPSSRGRGPP